MIPLSLYQLLSLGLIGLVLLLLLGIVLLMRAVGANASAAAWSAASAVRQAGFDFLDVDGSLTDRSMATTLQLEALTAVANATHMLVNSNMQAQLEISAVALRRIADLTHDPADRAIAANARRLLNEHIAKQGQVDRQVAEDVAAHTAEAEAS